MTPPKVTGDELVPYAAIRKADPIRRSFILASWQLQAIRKRYAAGFARARYAVVFGVQPTPAIVDAANRIVRKRMGKKSVLDGLYGLRARRALRKMSKP